jgi:hypothetical protein
MIDEVNIDINENLMLPEIFKGFLVLGGIFIPLERIFSLHKQKI